jgi:hypothetical protein
MSNERHQDGLFLSFGSGVRLISEDQFLRQFLPAGITRKGFRRLCRALSVPMLEIGSSRYVDMLSMLLALRGILRVGEPDFLCPGSRTLDTQKAHKRGGPTATKLDLERFQRNFHYILSELVAASRINGVRLGSELSNAATKAARRLTLACLHHYPLQEQDEHSEQALRQAIDLRIFEDPVDVPPPVPPATFTPGGPYPDPSYPP